MDPRKFIIRSEVERGYPSKFWSLASSFCTGIEGEGPAGERMIAVHNSPVVAPLAHKTGARHATAMARQPLTDSSALGINVAVPFGREPEGSVKRRSSESVLR